MNVTELGECPAPQDSRLNGLNGGVNAGRMCWLEEKTLCGGTVQGDFGKKLRNCMKCEFLHIVYKEEGSKFSYGMKQWFEMQGQSYSD